MSKLFLLAIGGSGVRVLRSLSMLLASGSELKNTTEIIPVVIDSDLANGNWTTTKNVMEQYKKIKDEIKTVNTSFFNTKISGLNDYLSSNDKTKDYYKIQLEGTENTEFKKFIGYNDLDPNNKALVELLFSKENLEINMSEGFYGNPNVGSVVFTQLKNSKEFKALISKFSKGDRIFFISSVFGGTGAAGFPTIVKLIRNDANENVKKAKIGAISIMPYFGLMQDENSKINSEVFLAKTKAAIEYLKDLTVDAQYYIGDEGSRSASKYQNTPGSKKQNNRAHYVELCSALSIFHFMELSDNELDTKENYYYGMHHPEKDKPLSFSNFPKNSYNYIKHLVNYFYFNIYLNNEKDENIGKATWSKDVTIASLDKNFFSGSFYSTLDNFNSEFLLWLTELTQNNKSLELFNGCFNDIALENSSKEEIIKGIRTKLKSFVNKKNFLEIPQLTVKSRSFFSSSPISQYTELLNEEVKSLGGTNITNASQKFITIFSKGTEKFVNNSFTEFDNQKINQGKPTVLNHYEPSTINSHWFSIAEGIDTSKIIDPDQTKIHKEITSIPSPFARIKLCETAFLYTKANQTGTTPYHRIVSDCLDVWITIFNQDKAKQDMQIKEWDRGDNTNPGDLGKLLNSPNQKHKLLGENLKLFLDQEDYFKNWRYFYIVVDRQKVIGGTSPLTVFFPTANREGIGRTFGNDVTFDSDYCEILKRDNDFQEYVYRFREMCKTSTFNGNLDRLNDYLDNNPISITIDDNQNYETPSLYEELKSISGRPVQLFSNITIKKKKSGTIGTFQSDLKILSNRKNGNAGSIPLVLWKDFFPSSPMQYTTGAWNNPDVPYFDSNPINSRILPEQGVQYPYYTISDFLEPYIVELNYPINRDHYYDPNEEDKSNEERGFLLPLKPLFFEYFSTEDLISGYMAKDHKRYLEIIKTAGGGAEVILRIPIQKNEYIEFKRIYSETSNPPDESKNEGVLVKTKFSVNIAPPIVGAPNPNYRVMLINVEDTSKRNYKLDFYNKSSEKISEDLIHKSRRTEDKEIVITDYYAIQEEFQFIQVQIEYPDFYSILIPKFKPYKTRGTKFKVAIDFGTTNTHIEIKEGTKHPESFSIDSQDLQLATLHKKGARLTNKEFTDHLSQEFIPEFIKQSSRHALPTRTVLCEKLNIDFHSTETRGLVVSNIPFGYSKESMLTKSANIVPNLKWIKSGDDEERVRFSQRIRLYFEEIIFLIRNKILLNGGDLFQTELVWFYPYSMDPFIRDSYIQPIWDELFQTYIHEGKNTTYYSESIAPYYFYLNNNDVTGSIVASIDIGGGTTDVAIYQEKKPLFLTSFRFASNSLFGDGYGKGLADKNGFIIRHKSKILEALKKYELTDLEKTLEQGLEISNKDSNEIISFFFSLENTVDTKQKKVTISFSDMLQEDTKLKIVFLLYYSAILYHIAKIVKLKDIELPKNLIFTGMGSKIINLIVKNEKTLEEYTRVFIEEITGKKYGGRKFSIIQNKVNPKEATCKGGLYMNPETVQSDIDEYKSVLLGSTEDCFVSYRETEVYYKDINDTYLQSVKEEFKTFINRFFEIGQRQFFESKFGIKDYELIKNSKSVLLNDEEIIDSLKEGLSHVKQEIGNSNEKVLIETLFFYPMIGLLNQLVTEIAKGDSK